MPERHLYLSGEDGEDAADMLYSIYQTHKGKITTDLVIADLGCGRGQILKALGNQFSGSRLYGVDVDKYNVGTTKGILPNAELYHGSFVETPWPDNTFDLITTELIFDYSEFHDLYSFPITFRVRELGSEIHRLLKLGGCYIPASGDAYFMHCNPGVTGELVSSGLMPPKDPNFPLFEKVA